jgi:hypothetical protein
MAMILLPALSAVVKAGHPTLVFNDFIAIEKADLHRQFEGLKTPISGGFNLG